MKMRGGIEYGPAPKQTEYCQECGNGRPATSKARATNNGKCLKCGEWHHDYSKPKTKGQQMLKPEDVQAAIGFKRTHPNATWPYTIPLPGWDTCNLHIGCFARSTINTETAYTVIELHANFAVVVPVSDPVCAYVVKQSHLERIAISEAARIAQPRAAQ